ncbi:motility associated factor glycosyltransferase family protein [Campylobacter concisus]|uniref:PseE protein, putative pseudaminic acid transferase n=1 Tax=Campylobacter concisus TaxID=199 RepID=A0A0M4TCM3_9BACT|nr:6-hydroxymethylpterin diphosphokinase MptE-like protein [Campylobacter concisus]ALF48274.1 PseE protein, putative pseudaminic acid transferase [Campylobacter concisus]
MSDKKNKLETKEKKLSGITNPIFEKNLQALFQQDEVLAARLFGMNLQTKYEVILDKSDPIYINIINKESNKTIYKDPVEEISKMLIDIEKKYKRYPGLFFYGLGNGILYKALAKNETHKKIIVVEPELEIIHLVLNIIDISNELKNEQIILFYSEFATYAQFYYLVSHSDLDIYAKTYSLIIHSNYYDNFADDYIKINKNITRAFSQNVVSHGNSIDDLLIGTKQHIENLPHMLTNYCYTNLVKKRHGLMDTAIIVSTGPSLDKQLETLKKFAPYVSIISVDASYPILARNGIKPDYVTSIERMIPTSTFFEKKHPRFDDDINFIVASVTHNQTVKNILPRRLVLTMRPQQEEKMFRLNKYGYLGVGHSCANMAYQLAYVLGHKNIIFIGQDLAFGKDGASHAKGHTIAQPDENLYTIAYGGKGEVRTTYVWMLFKNQFENDIEQAKLEDIKSYNCTEGGARINGAIEKPFLEVINELCKGKKVKNLPNIKKDSDKVANKNLSKAYEVIRNKIRVQTQAKEKIEKVFLELTPKIDNFMILRDKGEINTKHFKELVGISNKIDKLKNCISHKKYMRYIENIFVISTYHQELELAKVSVAPSDTDEEKTNKLVEWIEFHKYWLFSAAGGINADIETTKEASKPLIKELKKRGIFPKKD